MPMKIVRNDITKMSVDAVVNAANAALKMGGGVCGAIFKAAGAKELQQECDKIGSCEVGQAVITKGYNLPAKYVIHTVGPVWRDGNFDEAKLLHNCYTNSLNLALKKKCSSIAFPLISSGIYDYPKEDAFRIAVNAISEFLINHDMTVYLVVYDKSSYIISEKLFSSIGRYIDDNYVDERRENERRRYSDIYEAEISYNMPKADYELSSKLLPVKKIRSLKELVSQLDENFSQSLLRLIDEKGMEDVEVYKRANIDRKLFSKIRTDKNYKPRKITAIAFAIALRLNIDETLDLLSKAGYTLSNSNKFDVIIKYFIEEENFNIHEINEALFTFEQDCLGA